MQNKLLNELNTCNRVIGYTPLQDEIEYHGALSTFQIPHPDLYIPVCADNNPAHIAKECTEKFGSDVVCVITPGTKFDIYGNRKGRGGGWYDRFFTHVPQTWIRIGVCERQNLSSEKLDTHEWDIPMHGLLIFDALTSEWSFLDIAKSH